jgi:dephospho-CoA kinase
MVLYGLTGGIGSGKSEVGRMLAELGFFVIDADKIAHEILDPGGEAEVEVLRAFGPEVMENHRISREALARRVFADPAARRTLESITHPLIVKRVSERCLEAAARGVPLAVIEATLLGEQGRVEPWLRGLILVTSPLPLRIERLKKCRGMSDEEIEARIRAQTDPEEKRNLAAWVIENDGTLDQLRRQVESLAKKLQAEVDTHAVT